VTPEELERLATEQSWAASRARSHANALEQQIDSCDRALLSLVFLDLGSVDDLSRDPGTWSGEVANSFNAIFQEKRRAAGDLGDTIRELRSEIVRKQSNLRAQADAAARQATTYANNADSTRLAEAQAQAQAQAAAQTQTQTRR
jgi:hypothetical protein